MAEYSTTTNNRGSRSQKMAIAFLAPNNTTGPPSYSTANAVRTTNYPYPAMGANNYQAPALHMRELERALPQQSQQRTTYYQTPVTSPPPGYPAVRYSSVSTSSNSSGSISAQRYAPTTSAAHNTPRAPRPSYSEEQKFYIMYARIIRDMSWPDIEDGFSDIFGQRSKGGLTSVYYRIRRSWGLEEVLKGGPETFEQDKRLINAKAANFSEDFLIGIGYLQG